MTAPSRSWISVASLDHVEAAARGGFTQADHGADTRLRRLRPGDRVVFYSPRTTMRGGAPVRRFTALAVVTGEEPYRVTISDGFRPWRLACRFDAVDAVDARPLAPELSFVPDTGHWGLPFRRGLFTVPEADFRTIADRMGWSGARTGA